MGEKEYSVGSIKWPLYRYEVLMPVQENNDLLEWLYLSLLIYQNGIQSKSWDSYMIEEQNDVVRIIKEKFPNVFDDELIKKIQKAIQRDFVSMERLVPSTLNYISTYENLFTDRVEVYQVYQDGLTGSVLPDFSDLNYLETMRYCDEDNSIELQANDDILQPTNRQIFKALKDYKRFTKYTVSGDKGDSLAIAGNDSDELTTSDDEQYEESNYMDPDSEVAFDSGNENFEEIEKPSDIDNGSASTRMKGLDSGFIPGHKHIVFLDNSKSVVNIQVNIYVINNKIEIDAPFVLESTKRFIKKRLIIAAHNGRYPLLQNYLKNIENDYIQQEMVENNPLENITARMSTANQLKYFGDTYRLIENLKDESIKHLLIDADSYLDSGFRGYFNTIRQYLEALIYPIRSWDYSRRSKMLYKDYCMELEIVCKKTGLNGKLLMSERNYQNWKQMRKDSRGRKDKEPMLKPDLAEVLMTNRLVSSNKFLYEAFIDDVFKIYGKGSNDSHYNRNSSRPSYEKNKEDVEMIFNITQATLGMYEVKNG